ncbi:MAG: hypothetical protein QG581_436 [Patescibacteria group bacterium]|nr:hypothetical protein [Patescibacteria group bacterium]
MDTELLARLDAQNKKLDAIYVSVEKTRKYFQWTLIATIVMFVLPLIGIAAIIPWFINTMLSAYSI